MHAAWIDDYVAFRDYILEHLGPKPSSKHSIDRIENDGNYEPGNLRWATADEQARNRGSTKLSLIDVKFVRHWRKRGFSNKAVSSVFGVHPSYVSHVYNDGVEA
jgi:hypothetical protein